MSAAGNLTAWLLEAALESGAGARCALREGDRAWTYDELAGQVGRLSSALRGLRLQRGERVLILMSDTLEAAAAILGVVHAGAVAVPVSELSTPDDVQDLVLHAGATLAIVDTAHEQVVDAVRSETPDLREVICVGSKLPGTLDYHGLLAAATPLPPVPMGDTDVSLLLYSAGSGPGELRAVPHGKRAIAAVHASFARDLLGLTAQDRILSVARLSTSYGLGAGLLLPLSVQAESLLFPAQPHSALLFAALDSYEPSVLFATPSVYSQLAHDAERMAVGKPLARLRHAVAGAEGMPERLIPRIRSVLGTEVVVGYGLTEIFQFALAGRSSDPGARAGVCGRPLSGVQVRLVDEDGDPVGVDEIGTLELTCDSLFGGYWGGGNTTEAIMLGDGWFRTRDRFMVDREGNYHHCGRVDDLFKVGGKWVSPVEVERALVAHEAVWEAAVIGAEDDEGLIKPLAFVVTNVGHTADPKLEAELKEYVKNVLAPYKYPRWIEFVDALPRGPGGKLLRYKLRPARRPRRAETGADKTPIPGKRAAPPLPGKRDKS
ncbi:MAG TPA: benzoate-CoA ligase family protein [Kofleriaceae bacterium]|nr:benzoate-CoA ligase family protein [Kofleriaceae bacterium]